MAVIECTDLTKTYSKRVTALRSLTLNINEGTSFGLLGENGAGKSTLVRIIMGFIYPTAGNIRVLGETQVSRAHLHIGYVHERPIFETRFTARAYLTYLAQLSGLWGTTNTSRVSQLLTRVNLSEAADRTLGTYSKGMLQRLAIAQAILSEPDLLILDEPTSGLDPRSQWEVRQILASLRKEGKTLLICSHYLTEIEALCDTVGILRRGTLLLHGKVDDLVHAQGIVEIVLAPELDAAEITARLQLNEQIVETDGNLLRLVDSTQQAVLVALLAADIPIVSLNPVSRTLEEVYVSTTENSETKVSQEVSSTVRGGVK